MLHKIDFRIRLSQETFKNVAEGEDLPGQTLLTLLQ